MDQNELNEVGREILQAAGVGGHPRVTLVKTENDVYRLETADATFYIKTFTKDWYSPKHPDDTAGCVVHEASAYRILARNGLATPRVVTAALTSENVLNRPFLLLTGLSGRPLTEVLTSASAEEFDAALRAVGRFMSRMHAITFAYPGYLMSEDGPTSPPDSSRWRHAIWVPETLKECALRKWASDRGKIPAAILDRAIELYSSEEQSLQAEYLPPRFTHGDCHAHQFFVQGSGTDWEVTGVVDMEVASAGDYGADFTKFGLELAGRFPSGKDWWSPLLAGYGRCPPIGPTKLRLAVNNYDADYLAPHNWPGTPASRLAHILAARDWTSLFDLTPLCRQ